MDYAILKMTAKYKQKTHGLLPLLYPPLPKKSNTFFSVYYANVCSQPCFPQKVALI